jgi:hypothetical protein
MNELVGTKVLYAHLLQFGPNWGVIVAPKCGISVIWRLQTGHHPGSHMSSTACCGALLPPILKDLGAERPHDTSLVCFSQMP